MTLKGMKSTLEKLGSQWDDKYLLFVMPINLVCIVDRETGEVVFMIHIFSDGGDPDTVEINNKMFIEHLMEGGM